MKLQVSLACGAFDRTRPVLDGRIPIHGCDVISTVLLPEEAFHRAFKFQEFDITELSLSSYALMVARGDSPYVAIPAFVSRVFRHSGIYIRNDRGIKSPQDLKGRVVGLPEYQMTANVWIRGMLEDEYGVKPSDIHWRQGGLEEGGRGERAPLVPPKGVDLQVVPSDQTLTDLLERGEIDALITARAPSCFDRKSPVVDRLFPRYREVEQDYFRKTKLFPIMHLIGIRKTLLQQHPWLAVNVYKAFLQAKQLSMSELQEIAYYFVGLPWLVADFDAAVSLMGPDFWPYGFKENQHDLKTFLRYHFDQGISQRRVEPEELFAEPTLELSKI